MNAPLKLSRPIIGLDTSRSPLLLLAATPNDDIPGAIIPEAYEAFESLAAFSRYWDSHWRNSGPLVAVPTDSADPLCARDWLRGIGQETEAYEWFCYTSHLRGDLTLQNMGIDPRYRRPYVLALYARHRQQAGSVSTLLWGKLLDACSLLEEIRHGVHRLAAATREPESAELEVPF